MIRVAPILNLVHAASEADPEIRELYAELHAARRRNLARFIEGLKAIGGLREGITVEQGAADVWSLGSPELFLMMTTVGGADGEGYRAWLEGALVRLLAP